MTKQARIRELNANDDRTEEEEAELEYLYAQIRTEQGEASPRPTCCEAAKRYPAVYLTAPETGVGDASWQPALIEAQYDPTIRDSTWYENLPGAKFCTFCGATLPKMVRKAVPPEPLCIVTDGGYYCDTCEERLNGCTCLPPTAAFEPAP